MPIGSPPASTGKVMRFTGTSVLKVEDGLIAEEIGLDDGVTALRQLGLIPEAGTRRRLRCAVAELAPPRHVARARTGRAVAHPRHADRSG